MSLGRIFVVLAGIAVLVKLTGGSADSSETLDPWPFQMNEVKLSCEKNQMFVTAPDGRRYAVNGTAKNFAPEPRIETIQAYYDTTAVIRRGTQLCETGSGPVRLVAPVKATPPEPAQASLEIEPRSGNEGFYATVEADHAIDGKRPKLVFVCKGDGSAPGLQFNLVRAPQTAPPLKGVYGTFQVDNAELVKIELSWFTDGQWVPRDQDNKAAVSQLALSMLKGQQISLRAAPAQYIVSPVSWSLKGFGPKIEEVRRTCIGIRAEPPTAKLTVQTPASAELREVSEMRALYEELQSFKDDPEFRRRGFSPCCRYKGWSERVLKIKNETDPQRARLLLQKVGFVPGELWQLGAEYMRRDKNSAKIIESLEPAIRKGLYPSQVR